jgi:hypothetical protein
VRKTPGKWIKLVRNPPKKWIKLVRKSPSGLDQARENTWIMLVRNDTKNDAPDTYQMPALGPEPSDTI